ERHLARVDVVVRAVGEDRPDVDEGVAREDSALERLLHPRVDCGDVLARDDTTGDLVDELVTATGAGWLERDHNVAVLAAATRLADVPLLDLLDRNGDGLAVGNLRLADVGDDVELAHHSVDENVEVQLAHAGDDGLTGLVVGA